MGSWVFFAGREENAVFNGGHRFVTHDLTSGITREVDIATIPNLALKKDTKFRNVNNQYLYHHVVGQYVAGNVTTYQYTANYAFPLGDLKAAPRSVASKTATNSSIPLPSSTHYFNGRIFFHDITITSGQLLGTVNAVDDPFDVSDLTTVGTIQAIFGVSTVTFHVTPSFFLAKKTVTTNGATITLNYQTSVSGYSWGANLQSVATVSGSPGYTSASFATNDTGSRWLLFLLNTYGGVTNLNLSTNNGSSWANVPNVPAALSAISVTPTLYYLGTNILYCVGNTLYQTVDGSSWTTTTPLGTEGINHCAYDGASTYIFTGNNGAVVTTTNFSTYTPYTAFNFGYHDIYQAIYTTQEGNLIGSYGSTLITTEASDTAVITGTSNTGTGVIQGTLRLDTSLGAFAAREVYLYNYTTGAKVAETLSDATTGVWQFTAVAPGDYFVVGTALKAEADTRDFDALGVITVA